MNGRGQHLVATQKTYKEECLAAMGLQAALPTGSDADQEGPAHLQTSERHAEFGTTPYRRCYERGGG